MKSTMKNVLNTYDASTAFYYTYILFYLPWKSPRIDRVFKQKKAPRKIHTASSCSRVEGNERKKSEKKTAHSYMIYIVMCSVLRSQVIKHVHSSLQWRVFFLLFRSHREIGGILCSAYDDLIKKYCNIYIEWCRWIPAMCRSLLFQLLQYVYTVFTMSRSFFTTFCIHSFLCLNFCVLMTLSGSTFEANVSYERAYDVCEYGKYYNHCHDMICFINNSHPPPPSCICLCEWTLFLHSFRYFRSKQSNSLQYAAEELF